MTATDRELLDNIEQMAEQAPTIGICAMPFRILHTRVMELIAEKDLLLERTGASAKD